MYSSKHINEKTKDNNDVIIGITFMFIGIIIISASVGVVYYIYKKSKYCRKYRQLE